MSKNRLAQFVNQYMMSRRKRKDATLSELRRRFYIRYFLILDSCRQLHSCLPTDPALFAQAYMSHIFRSEYDEAWWIDHSDYLTQPWFIWQYMCSHGMAEPPKLSDEQPFLVIRPEKEAAGECLKIEIKRNPQNPQQGLLYAYGAADENMDRVMRRSRCKRIPGGYVRKVDECAAPIEDRAVQICLSLLENGCSAGLAEKKLYDRILNEDYEPEHRYWIRAAAVPEWLQLVYPYDVQLHRYLLQMGGRWTGREMLVHVAAADRMQDIVRLYDFRMTAAAERLIRLWNQALDQATVYRPRRNKAEPPQPSAMDRFRELMKQEVEIPEDLIDQNV